MHKGIAYILIATFLFTIVNSMVKWLENLPVVEIVFFRSLITFVISFYLLKRIKNKNPNLKIFGHQKKWLFLRGLFGVLALYLLFVTIKKIPLATATTIQYTSPIFTVLLASCIHHEKTHTLNWLFILISFTGIVLLKEFDPRVEYKYLGIGLLSSLFSAIAYNIIKKLSHEHPLTIVMYFPMVGIPFMLLPTLMQWVMPNPGQWIILVLIGLCTQMAQYLMTRALLSDKAYIIVPFKYIGAVYALLIGLIFFQEQLPAGALMGILLVLIGISFNSYFTQHNA